MRSWLFFVAPLCIVLVSVAIWLELPLGAWLALAALGTISRWVWLLGGTKADVSHDDDEDQWPY